ncbi:MAG: type II toxin-antitoxin system VapC family toxin [Candidatus Sulfotelmatobacter sp.]|jgi:hypothetical protein
MSKTIQLRNVPASLHRSLKAGADLAGMSLSDFLLAEIREIAEGSTLAELRHRLRRRKPVALSLDTARLVRGSARSSVIVLDASAAIDWLLQTAAGRRIESRIYSRGESLHTPHLFDLEVAQVLRRWVREAKLPPRRAARPSRTYSICD